MLSSNSSLLQLLSNTEVNEENFIEILSLLISEVGFIEIIYWLSILILILFIIITLLEICNITCTIIGRKKNKKYYQNLHNNGINV